MGAAQRPLTRSYPALAAVPAPGEPLRRLRRAIPGSRANDRIAAIKTKSSDRRKMLAQAYDFIEAQEIKLAEANAEIELRKSRVLRPEPRVDRSASTR